MPSLIYIIEDDDALRNELAHLLELTGFSAAVCTRFDTAAADALAADADCVARPEAAVGHRRAHHLDRHQIAQRRAHYHADLSNSEFDEVMSMNLGADDYVTKPYSPAVLIARIQSILRRSSTSHDDLRIERKGSCSTSGRAR